MNRLHCWMSSLWLLLCITVCTCRATVIYGFEGQAVILPCKYDADYHGVCEICWMKGNIPTNGCGAQILYANQKRVLKKSDGRYQLMGALQEGDASLTILNVRKSDSGKYGCRVHVPGWFNDKKVSIVLVIKEAPRWTTTTPGYVTTTTQIPTKAPVSTTPHETTSVTEDVTTKHPETEQTSATPGYVTNTTQIPSKGAPAMMLENEPEVEPVSDDADILAAISVSVILTVLILGISAVCVMSKHRRWRKTFDLTKNASISVSYSNLEKCGPADDEII